MRSKKPPEPTVKPKADIKTPVKKKPEKKIIEDELDESDMITPKPASKTKGNTKVIIYFIFEY